MKSIITLFITIIFAGVSFAQNESNVSPQKYSTEFEIGEDYFNTYAYRVAIKHYLRAYEKDSSSHIIKLRLAQSYFFMRDMEDAEYWANLVLGDGYVPTSQQVYFYIEILASNQHYDEAAYWYNKHIVSDTLIDSTKKARMRNFLNDPSTEGKGKNIQIEPININSTCSDLGANYYGKRIVFSSGRRPSVDVKKVFKNDHVDYLKLYYAELDSNKIYKDPKLFDSHINTQYHQGPIAFYDNDTKVIYTQSNMVKRRFFGKKAGRSESGEVNLELYMADYVDGTITNIIPFEYNSNSFSTGHPTVSADGKKLIFSSDRPDAIGGADLYICYRIGDHSWTPPKNLGPKVNTTGSELFPFLHGNVLYFTSDGHKGNGGLDIYGINLINDEPQELSHLEYPINSSYDDFGLVTKYGREGFFSTNRGNPLDDEIYIYEYIKEIPPLTVHVSAIDTVDSIYLDKPRITIEDTSSGEYLIPMKNVGDTVYQYVLEPKTNYLVSAQHSGYFITDSIFYSGDSISGLNEWLVPLQQIKANVSIEIPNIYFDFDKSNLRDTSRIQLNSLISWLEENPTVKIQLSAHTDSRGNDEYNMALSQRRAQAVVDYLVESGISEDRLEAKGFGASMPLIDCLTLDCTLDDFQKNRRVEMKVISTEPDETSSEETEQEPSK